MEHASPAVPLYRQNRETSNSSSPASTPKVSAFRENGFRIAALREDLRGVLIALDRLRPPQWMVGDEGFRFDEILVECKQSLEVKGSQRSCGKASCDVNRNNSMEEQVFSGMNVYRDDDGVYRVRVRHENGEEWSTGFVGLDAQILCLEVVPQLLEVCRIWESRAPLLRPTPKRFTWTEPVYSSSTIAGCSPWNDTAEITTCTIVPNVVIPTPTPLALVAVTCPSETSLQFNIQTMEPLEELHVRGYSSITDARNTGTGSIAQQSTTKARAVSSLCDKTCERIGAIANKVEAYRTRATQARNVSALARPPLPGPSAKRKGRARGTPATAPVVWHV